MIQWSKLEAMSQAATTLCELVLRASEVLQKSKAPWVLSISRRTASLQHLCLQIWGPDVSIFLFYSGQHVLTILRVWGSHTNKEWNGSFGVADHPFYLLALFTSSSEQLNVKCCIK